VRWRSIVVLAGMLVGTAHADVGQVVRDAQDKIKAGDFVGAAAKFREAYRLEPKPDWVCNAGIAYHKAGDRPALTQLYLRMCLERGTGVLDRAFMDLVTGALGDIETALAKGSFAPVDVAVTPGTAAVAIPAFGSDDSFIGSRVVWLPWGEHAVTVRADGYVEQTVPVKIAGHDRVPLRITLERKPEQAPPPPATTIAPLAQRTPPPQPVETVERRSLILPIATSAVTVVAVVVSTVGFVGARNRADRAAFAVDETVYERDQDSIDRWNRLFGISGALAVVGAGASGYLLYRALHPVTRIEVQAAPTPTGAAVMLRGRF
jgi:hypothetical protein